MLIFGEWYLRRVLASYTAYYNQARTHLALQKDAPLHRAVQRSGVIVAIPLHCGQSGRPLAISNDERPQPASGIFRLQKRLAKAQLVSPPPVYAFNGAMPDRPVLIKIV
jgi:hypothetical protein